jgi:hypothetical protein
MSDSSPPELEVGGFKSPPAFHVLLLNGVALPQHENCTALRPRVIWLTGLFCDSRVLGTDVSSELLVALLCIVHFHLVNGLANERPQRVEHPCAFGASPALKSLPFGPYQFATRRLHRHLEIRCGYTSLRDCAALAFYETATSRINFLLPRARFGLSQRFLNTPQNRGESTRPGH